MVEVPSDTVRISGPIMSEPRFQLFISCHTEEGIKTIYLPELEHLIWQPHSDSTTITEEQAAEIVDKVHIKNPEEWAYKNYVDGFKLDKIGVTVGYSRAIDSYESLLQSMGLEGKRVVNLKRA